MKLFNIYFNNEFTDITVQKNMTKNSMIEMVSTELR